MIQENVELVAAARAGDEAALLNLIEACRPQLRKYATSHCESADVEEAVQDALWLLYKKIGTLRVLEAFLPWLFRIVRRGCYRLKHQRRNLVSLELVEELPTTHSWSTEFWIDMARQIAELPPTYRDVLILRDVAGFNTEETASELRIPLAAAKSRLHRARHAVRQSLARSGDKGD